MTIRRLSAVTLLLLSNICVGQTVVTCHIKNFNAPASSPLAPLSNALGINRYGNVVGQAHNGKGYVRFTDGTVHTIPVNITGYPNVVPTKRNASGITVGYVYNSQGSAFRPFVQTGNSTTAFSVPGYTILELSGINRYGTIVGNLSGFSPTVDNSFVYKNGKLTKLPIPVANRTTAISDTGVIVGDYVNNTNPQPFDDTHGFVYANGTFQDLSVPWASTTFITDINASGMIVGVTEGPGGNFIYKDGKFYNPKFVLPDGNVITGSIFGVNGYGEITGNVRTGATTGPMLGKCNF